MRTIQISAAFLLLVSSVVAQQTPPTAPATSVPRLVRISNTFHAADGQAPAPVESVTLSVYRDEQGGSPLWLETQNVSVDSEGRYNVLMGSTLNDGVPFNLFDSADPRWLGVKFNRPGEVEPPRTRLASVPYALKASDAETLGGKPASAYLLAPGANLAGTALSSGTIATASSDNTGSAAGPDGTTGVKPRTISGTQNFFPYFTDASNDLGNSVMQQAGGSIGVGTVPGAGAASTPSLDLRTYPFAQIGMGQTTDYLTFFASDTYGPAIYWDPGRDLRLGKGGASLYNAFGFTEQMRIQSSTGNIGIGTQAPASKLDVAGSINAAGNLTAAGTVSVGSISAGSANVTGALSAGSLSTGNITSTGTITLANVSATGTVTAAGNITTTSGNVSAPTLISSSDIYLAGDIVDNGVIIYREPYNPSNVAVGPGAGAGSDSSGVGNTSTGCGTMAGNGGGGGCSGSGNARPDRPMPGAPHAQRIGNNPHPDASGPTGSYNTAHGYLALSSLSSGYYNTATGAQALTANTAGYYNTAHGYQALYSNTTGYWNTANGVEAMFSNTTGFQNTAHGYDALYRNTTGGLNTADGVSALSENTTGILNTAIGYGALLTSTIGNGNTAIGYNAGSGNSTGSNNVFVGYDAGFREGSLFYIGSNNIAIGYGAGGNNTSNSNNIHIGSVGTGGDSAVIRIGGNTALGDPVTQTAFYASGIGNATVSGVPVLVNTSTGQLGVASSSRRFKEDIQDMADSSDDLMRLRPVTFRYKQPFDDGAKPVQYGLIAEEVAEVYPDLVAHSADGQIETVKYQLLDPMLLNEVQKQQARIELLERENQSMQGRLAEIKSLQERMAKLETMLESAVSAKQR